MEQKKELPPFVRFSEMPVEDRNILLENGRYGFRDVKIAHITRPGQRDTVVKEAELWLNDLKKASADGHIPPEWYPHFRSLYDNWCKGLELPVAGTPIRGWTVLSPSQVENLLLLNFRTVEELAAANEAAIQRIGLGGLRMREMARDWLAAADNGKAAAQLEAQRVQNETLTLQIEALQAQVKRLSAAQEAVL